MKKVLFVALMLTTLTWELQSQRNEMLFLLEVRLFFKSDFLTNAGLSLADALHLDAPDNQMLSEPNTSIWRQDVATLFPNASDQYLFQSLPFPTSHKEERLKSLALTPPVRIHEPSLVLEPDQRGARPMLPAWVKQAALPQTSFNRMVNPQFDLIGIQLKF